MSMNFIKDFKSYFFRGLAVLVPTIITIWIFVWGYKFIQENISIHINRGLVWLTMYFTEQDASREIWRNFWIDGWGSVAGFVLALIAVCVVGAVLASVVGKTLWRFFEKSIMRIPVIKKVYPYVKQITDFLLAQEKKEKLFKKVVAVQYPRMGIWSLGMVTGSGLRKVSSQVNEEMLTILIPTSPTPFTGFVIMVPKKDTIEMDITIEEAIRFTVSGGVITPHTKLDDI